MSSLKILPLCFLLLGGGTALAAGSDSIIAAGTGLGGNFDAELSLIAGTFVQLAKVIVVIMTAVAGIMVGLGIEDGKRTMWTWLLGAGLAINFGAFLYETGLWDMANSAGTGPASPHFYEPELQTKGKNVNILSGFMDNYLNGVIKPGSQAILPPCLKLLLIITIIETAWEMSFKLVSGDKVKYLLTVIIKCGFFMFLMMNWIEIMDALESGFQQIGFLAGGASADGADLKPDSIYQNGWEIFYAFYDKSNFSFDAIGLTLINIIGLFTVVIATFLTAIEMFMARIEFFTMALITIPLLPFAVTSKFSFLSDKAIGAMINLAIKVSVISFITAMAVPFMTSFAEKVAATESAWTQIGVMFQCVLAALVIYFLTKKIPDLVTGLLSGQPSLGGAGMLDMAKGAAATAASGVGMVRGASALAQAAGGKGGMSLSTLGQLGKAALYSRGPVQGYRAGIQKMNQLNNPEYSGRFKLGEMAKGKNPDNKNSPSGNGGGSAEDVKEAATKQKDERIAKTISKGRKFVEEKGPMKP